jgi:pimeloyl-ACP methyl ester carboxylesterase/membrane protein DedA with SNARE-associated domain
MARPGGPLSATGRYFSRSNPRARLRGRLWSAISVVLAAAACTTPRAGAPDADVEALRRTLGAGAPLNTTLSYLVAGNPAGPRLILVHGTPGQATGWVDYLLDPPPGLEVVALDRPGFGRSGPDRAVATLGAQAAAVVALLPVDGRPVVLLGHSLGGPVIARVAAEHPTRVHALVLLAGSLDPAQETIHPAQRVGAWGPVRCLLPRAIRNANAELMALKPELEALAPMLPRIRAKVVIVHGTLDDLVPMANVPFIEARLTGARCVRTIRLEGRNHFLPWNAADAVLARRGAGQRMLSPGQASVAWLQAVLAGMAEPWLIAVVLALTTLLLEDLAIAAGVALATQQAISWGLSLAAVGGGIALGDLGLYGLGVAATRVAWVRQRYVGERSRWAREQLIRRLPSAVLLARVIPGVRLVTYTACGFVRVPLPPFCAWVVLAVGLWTAGLYSLSVAIGQTLAHQLGLPPAIAVALPILVLAAAVPLLRVARQRLRGASR